MMNKKIVTLNASDIIRIESFIKNKYELCDRHAFCGAHTMAIAIQDSNCNKYVLKTPLKENFEWIDFQIYQHNKVADIFSKAYLVSNVNFEKIISYDSHYYIAKYYGEPLGNVINEADVELKQTVAHKLAKFLMSIHQNTSIKARPFSSYETPSLVSVYRYCFEALSVEERKFVKDIIDKLERLKEMSYATTFIHGDFRNDNILFDRKSGEITVIDFECSGYSNILREFALDALTSLGFSYKFWFMVVNHYCKLGNNMIKPDTVCILMASALIHEYGRCAMYVRAKDEDLFNRCQYMIKNLQDLFKEFGW